ncbi:MAG: VCBS repeat-containing protein [Armatimonadota bacterium]|nr:VCBS repeat-containing protein [Armatimonadota bacterium]
MLLVATLAPAAVAASCSNYRAFDLDGDGTAEYVSFTYNRVAGGHPMGGDIVVSHKINGRLKPVWRQRGLNPWKIEIGDVDGDGRKEVVAGVWKKSRYDPVFANRPFVYSWNGKRLIPRWLGSRLSRRFTDFVLCQLDRGNKTELIALEEAPRGAKYVTVYRWRAFGFDGVGRVGPITGVRSLQSKNGQVLAETGQGLYSLKLVKEKLKFTLISEAGNGRASVR